MKTVLIVIVLIAVCTGIGYFGLPILIEKETVGLRSEVQDVKQRLQKIEEESKAVPLQPDANVREVIKTVNAFYHNLKIFEDSFKKGMSATEEVIKKQGETTEGALKKQSEAIEKQKTATEEAFRKQAEAIERMNKDIHAKIQVIMFDATMAGIRGHILKTRVDLVAKNIGTAKTELDLINGVFEKVKTSAIEKDKKVIEELQGILKKARVEIDTDLPAALNKIDLLWHEMSRL